MKLGEVIVLLKLLSQDGDAMTSFDEGIASSFRMAAIFDPPTGRFPSCYKSAKMNQTQNKNDKMILSRKIHYKKMKKKKIRLNVHLSRKFKIWVNILVKICRVVMETSHNMNKCLSRQHIPG